MRALVVYDSVHGNTEQVAQAVAHALGLPESEARHVTEVEPEELPDLDVLVVGAPTHAFQPSPKTKQFLKSIPRGRLDGVRVAAFDTRISVEETDSAILSFMVKLFGYAAKPIANRLKRRGGDLALPPEGFYVADTEGPLKEGELERAADWARGLSNAR
jgi:flavodoxin